MIVPALRAREYNEHRGRRDPLHEWRVRGAGAVVCGAFSRNARAQPILESVGNLHSRKVLQQEQGPANLGVALRTPDALRHVFAHRCHLKTGQRVIDESGVSVGEFLTIHLCARGRSSGSRYPTFAGLVPRGMVPRLRRHVQCRNRTPNGHKKIRAAAGAAARIRIVPTYSSDGATREAKAFRARFNLDFTVPRLQEVISAISSYDFPSSSRNTNTFL